MTIFTDSIEPRKKLRDMAFIDKASALFFGVSFGKPKKDKPKPSHYSEINFTGYNGFKLSAWTSDLNKPKQALLLHGYIGEKSDLIEEAAAYEKMGYGVTLLDFFGSGDSEGSFTTIGFHESYDVHAAVNMIRSVNKDAELEVYAVSLGASALLKANHDQKLDVDRVVLETPFASMKGTICNRIKILKAPCFPGAAVLTWWGGIIHGFDSLNYKPYILAKNLHVPALIFAAENDERAPVEDSHQILNNISGTKKLVIFKDARHQSLYSVDDKNWTQSILDFHR